MFISTTSITKSGRSINTKCQKTIVTDFLPINEWKNFISQILVNSELFTSLHYPLMLK